MTTTVNESGVRANPAEARELVERGIAAARGGQRRVAAGLLARALKLDPRDERAWLWLSGVVDDPAQRAFCLQAVLRINPQNPHARRGLAYLERQGTVNARPIADLSVPAAAPETTTETPATPATSPAKDTAHRDWWLHWRWQHRETSRVRLVLWILPIVLLSVAVFLHQSVSIAREQALAALAAEQASAFTVESPSVVAVATPTPIPALEAEPLAVVESLTVSYLSAVEAIRADLRTATMTYRQETSQPGGASVNHVAATQRLRSTVAQALANLGELRVLLPAHEDYRRGLELELAGLDAILEFYSTYDVAHANRAALRFQEARAFIERAQVGFQAQLQLLGEESLISAYTIR